MYIRFAISTAILGAATLVFTDYAGANVSIRSQDLSATQAQVCPALVSDGAIADTPNANERLSVPVPPDNVLDLTYVCYGIGGDQHPEPPVIEIINAAVKQQTPQEATEFDQLPQDRVEFRSPF